MHNRTFHFFFYRFFLCFICFLFFFFFCFAVCLSLYLSVGLSEDDAYVDKLPTFERHFDSFAGTVMIPSERGEGEGVVKGVGGVFLCLFSICLMLFTQSALDTEG